MDESVGPILDEVPERVDGLARSALDENRVCEWLARVSADSAVGVSSPLDSEERRLAKRISLIIADLIAARRI